MTKSRDSWVLSVREEEKAKLENAAASTFRKSLPIALLLSSPDVAPGKRIQEITAGNKFNVQIAKTLEEAVALYKQFGGSIQHISIQEKLADGTPGTEAIKVLVEAGYRQPVYINYSTTEACAQASQELGIGDLPFLNGPDGKKIYVFESPRNVEKTKINPADYIQRRNESTKARNEMNQQNILQYI